jgi:hypothetical protein
MKKLLTILVLIAFAPILFLPFGSDAAVYTYMGRLLLDGYIPYVDGWDHKGISLYFINAFGYLIGFKSIIGIRILELVLILIAFSRIHSILRTKFPKLIAFIACAIGVFTLKYFFQGGNLTEEYGAIFTLIAISLLLKKEIKTLDYAIIGALFVINFTIRANLISFWGALFLMYSIQTIFRVIPLKTFLLNILKMAYGAITVVLLLLIYLISTNSFQDFIDAAFVFNFSYSNSTFSSTLVAIFASMKKYYLSVILIIAFAISLVKWYKDRTKKIELLLILWIPIELYFSNLSNRTYGHYFIMWTPLLILSFAVILLTLKEQLKASNRKLIIASAITFVLCFYMPSYMVLKDWQRVFVEQEETNGKKVSDHIANNYQNESLLVWGNDCYLYNANNKKAPTAFFYQSIFKYNSDLVTEKTRVFCKEILENKPELIVDTKRKGLVNLNGIDEIIDENQKRNLKEFLSIINTYYVLKEQQYGMDFYVLKEHE